MEFSKILPLLLFSYGCVVAQNKPIKPDVAYQTSFEFETPVAKNDAIAQFSTKLLVGKGYTFEAKTPSIDNLGTEHQRHQEYYKGILVEFGTLITHSKVGKTYFINAEIYNVGALNLVPQLNKQAAFDALLELKNNAKFLWNDTEQAAIMNYSKPEGELVILPNVKAGTVNLAYKYDVYTTEPLARDYIYLDANTGKLLLTNAIIKHAHKAVASAKVATTVQDFSALVAGSAATRYSGTKTIETTFNTSSNRYVLQDFTRGGGIFTYDSQRSPSYTAVDFKDADNNWIEYNNLNKDNAALDAHWGAEKTYDFWINNFSRNSYDNLGTTIKSYVHYRKELNASLVNAFWNGSVMSYGDGNTNTSPLTSVDICGHEIGHAVCSATAALVYANQSGGLNEGFSDIWGACIEQYARTGSLSGTPSANVWLIAEQLGTSPFRSMNNPLSKGDPDTYLGTNWLATGDESNCIPGPTNDQCGVHSNSGVLNHWFYILTVGKSGTNNAPVPDTYNVTGIGMVKAAQIAYLAERDYLTPNATFLDMRNATVSLASLTYCGASTEVIAVKNAWYAVNVGDAAVSYSTDIALKEATQTLNVACGASFSTNVKIENSGINTITQATISYSIDGAAPVNTIWNGNLSSCQSTIYSLALPAMSRGTHTVVVTVTVASDGNNSNNSRTIAVLSNTPGTIGEINTFENTSDVLVSYEDKGTNILWQRGTAAGPTLTDALAGNSKVYGTNLVGLYPPSTKSYLVSQCYNLSNVASPVLKFDMGFDLEIDYDLFYVQYSINAGATWNVLGTSSDTNWYNSDKLPNAVDCQNCVGAQWTGDGNLTNTRGGLNRDKREYSYNLSQFGASSASPASNIIFRFVFHSDPGLEKEGVILDNLAIVNSQLSLNQLNNENDFSIFPNPSSGLITISSTIFSDARVELVDSSGRLIFSDLFKNSTAAFYQEVNFGNLAQGIYLLTINADNNKITKKLIIE